MSMDGALEANAQFAESGKPSMCSFDDPSVAAESIIALDASACNPVLDAAQLEMFSAARVVIPFVGMQLVRPAARPAALASNRGQRVDQFLEDH